MENMVTEIPNKEIKRRPGLIQRKYLVDPRVQFKVITFLGGIAVICALIICAMAYERLMQLHVLFNNSMVAPIMMPQAFQAIATSLMYRLIAIVLIMIAIFVWAGILLTHKLTGPIWKLQYQLKKFHKGETIPPLKFRKGDAFTELPDLINKLIDGYKR